jgi:hypothetical protein
MNNRIIPQIISKNPKRFLATLRAREIRFSERLFKAEESFKK